MMKYFQETEPSRLFKIIFWTIIRKFSTFARDFFRPYMSYRLLMKRTLGQRTHVNCFKSSIVRRLNRDLGLIPGQEVILLRIHAHDTPFLTIKIKTY